MFSNEPVYLASFEVELLARYKMRTGNRWGKTKFCTRFINSVISWVVHSVSRMRERSDEEDISTKVRGSNKKTE